MVYYVQTDSDNTISNVSKKFKQGYITVDVPNFWLDRFLNNFNEFWVDSSNILHKPGTLQRTPDLSVKEVKEEVDEANNEINNIKSSTAEYSSAFSNTLSSNSESAQMAINSVRDTLIAVNSSIAVLPYTATKQELDDLQSNVTSSYTPLANSFNSLSSKVETKADISSLSSYVTNDKYTSDYSTFQLNVNNSLSDLNNKKADLSMVGSLTNDLKSQLSSKANQSSLNSLASDVSSKVNQSFGDSLVSNVSSKADQSVVSSIASIVSLKANQSAVDSINSNVGLKANQLDVINGLSSKASVSYVDNKSQILLSNLNSLDSRAIGNNDLSSAIDLTSSQIIQQVNSKADLTMISSANSILMNSIKDLDARKANSSTVEDVRNNLQNQINAFNEEDSGIVKNIGTIQEQVNGKANQADLNVVSSAVQDKVGKSDLDLLLNQKVDKNGIDSLSASFTNIISTKASMNDINSLSSTANVNFESLKNSINDIKSTSFTLNGSWNDSFNNLMSAKDGYWHVGNNYSDTPNGWTGFGYILVTHNYGDCFVICWDNANNKWSNHFGNGHWDGWQKEVRTSDIDIVDGKVNSNAYRIAIQEDKEKNDIQSLDQKINNTKPREDYIYKGNLSSNDDFNNITTPGVYWTAYQSPKNAPDGFSNYALHCKVVIETDSNSGGSTTIQTIIVADGWGFDKVHQMYRRISQFNNSQWGNWVAYANTVDIDNLNSSIENVKNSIHDNYIITDIDPNSDVLELTGPGIYRSNWGNQNTLKNFPGGNGASIIYVNDIGNSITFGKEIVVVNSWGFKYQNQWSNDHWTGWRMPVYQQDLDQLALQISNVSDSSNKGLNDIKQQLSNKVSKDDISSAFVYKGLWQNSLLDLLKQDPGYYAINDNKQDAPDGYDGYGSAIVYRAYSDWYIELFDNQSNQWIAHLAGWGFSGWKKTTNNDEVDKLNKEVDTLTSQVATLTSQVSSLISQPSSSGVTTK